MVHAHTATGPSPSTARYPTRFASRMHLSPQPTASAVGQAFPRHHARNPRRVSHAHGLAIIRFRSPLLTEYPLLQVLRCFTSLRTPRTSAVPAHDGWRVAPFGHPGIKAMSAAPPGLSRPHTSFIGTVCQGIHHTPLQATHTTKVHGRKIPLANSQTTNHHTKNDHKTIETNNRVRFEINSKTKIQKLLFCSRPLSSSQTTTPPGHPPRTNRHRATDLGDTLATTPHTRGRWRPGNPTARTTPHNPIRLFHASKPGRRRQTIALGKPQPQNRAQNHARPYSP